jgi:hypothetical protein
MAEYRFTFADLNAEPVTVAGDDIEFGSGVVTLNVAGEPVFWADSSAILHIQRVDVPKAV